jgi:hypothetical protein
MALGEQDVTCEGGAILRDITTAPDGYRCAR